MFGFHPTLALPIFWYAREAGLVFGSLPKSWLAQPTPRAAVHFLTNRGQTRGARFLRQYFGHANYLVGQLQA